MPRLTAANYYPGDLSALRAGFLILLLKQTGEYDRDEIARIVADRYPRAARLLDDQMTRPRVIEEEEKEDVRDDENTAAATAAGD